MVSTMSKSSGCGGCGCSGDSFFGASFSKYAMQSCSGHDKHSAHNTLSSDRVLFVSLIGAENGGNFLGVSRKCYSCSSNNQINSFLFSVEEHAARLSLSTQISMPVLFSAQNAQKLTSNTILNAKASSLITGTTISSILGAGIAPINSRTARYMLGGGGAGIGGGALLAQILGGLSVYDPFSLGANYNFDGICQNAMDGSQSECGPPPNEGEGSFAELTELIELRDTDTITDLVDIDLMTRNKKSLVRAGWAIVVGNLDLLEWAHCVVYGSFNKSRYNCASGRFLSSTSYSLAGPSVAAYSNGNLYIDSVSSEDDYVYSYQEGEDGERYYPGFAAWPGYLNALGYPGGGCQRYSNETGLGVGSLIGGFIGLALGGPGGAFVGAAIGGFVGVVVGDAVDACTVGERPAPWGYIKIADYSGEYFYKYMYPTWQWGDYADEIAAAIDVATALVHEMQHVCGAGEDSLFDCSSADLVENVFAWALLNKYRNMWVSKCYRGAYWDENYEWLEEDHAPDRTYVADPDASFGLSDSYDKSYANNPCQRSQLESGLLYPM